jgi:peptidoglycan/LPS O-acetylase OafA/YrhL
MTSVRALFRSGFHELSTRPAEQVPVLDALRTLAVLLVVVEHCVASVVPELAGAKGGILEHPVFQFGWTGVDLFFILSGYLIGRQLWREAQRTGTVDVPRFVLRRGFRIWPLYVFFIIVSSLILKRAPRLSDMLFYSNYAGGQVQGGWSLSTEEQFYIVMPLAAMLLGRWGMKVWLALIPLMIAGVLVARAITAPVLLSHGMSLAAVKDAMYFPAHLRSEALYVGLLIALVSTLRPAWFARPRDAGFSWTGFGIAVASTLSAGVLRKLNGVVFPFFSLALIFGGLTTWLLLDRSWISRALRGHVFYASRDCRTACTSVICG